MTKYKIAYAKLLKRGFYDNEIDTEKLAYIIDTNYYGWADLTKKSIARIMAYVCKTGFEE